MANRLVQDEDVQKRGSTLTGQNSNRDTDTSTRRWNLKGWRNYSEIFCRSRRRRKNYSAHTDYYERYIKGRKAIMYVNIYYSMGKPSTF